MAAEVLDGERVATRIKDELAGRIEALVDAGRRPGLGTVLVGDDGPSANYVAMKHRDCEALGISSHHVHLPADASADDVEQVITRLNESAEIDAYLLQYPFPGHLDYESLLEQVDPTKDADGLHPINLGRLVQGVEAPLACTPAGIVELLAAHDVEVEGRHVVIVGRGLTIGRPLANLLSLKRPGLNAAVTVVHTGVADLGAHTRNADILVAAAGSPGLVTPEMVKPGAAVVAAGVSFVDGKLRSDVADEVAKVAGWLSPRVGGVGPMTRAMLLANTVTAAERRR
jgi:methylenetetrahydrofolate dehydrogenase (NADP+) / methenyltetrahydrofolate cyclohydrolase